MTPNQHKKRLSHVKRTKKNVKWAFKKIEPKSIAFIVWVFYCENSQKSFKIRVNHEYTINIKDK